MTNSSGPSGSLTSDQPPVLDFRPQAAFEAGHLPGAVHIAWPDIQSLRTLLPPRHTLLLTQDAPSEAMAWLTSIGYPATPITPTADQLTEQGSATTRLWRPSPPLVRLLPELAPGVALDLGCGSGRDAVYLALHDWRVTAVDRAAGALQKARALAAHEGVSVNWLQVDVRRPETLPVAHYDLIVMMRFYQPHLFPWIATHLKSGGKVMVWAFHPDAEKPHKAHLKATPEQIAAQFSFFKTITATINTIEDGRPMTLYIGEKP